MNRIDIGGTGLEVQRIAAPGGLPDVRGAAPLVFLHEGLGSVAMWRDWPERLCQATGRAGVVYSRRGYGASDAVPDVRGSGRLAPDYMHHEAWAVLPALLEELRISRPVLVGHSDGGSIALLHAARHAVDACVVMAPHVVVEDMSVVAIARARDGYLSGALRERLTRYHEDVDGAFWQWNDAWLNPAFHSFDIRQLCQDIHAPVLAIQGEEDPYGSMAQIDQIEPAGPIERLKLAQCGHSPHRDQPDAVTAAISDFLRRRIGHASDAPAQR
jgi:pimeloyl-ACP methyl ester carboxylesterase